MNLARGTDTTAVRDSRPEKGQSMARCAYCGRRVDREAIHLEGEVFCSEDCLEQYDEDTYNDDDAEDNYDDDAYDYRDQ